MAGYKTNSGENLIVEWRIPVQQARYHKDGSWFMPLERFPAALCDPKGYVVFETQRDYETSQYLQIGQRVHVQKDICKLPRYVRVR